MKYSIRGVTDTSKGSQVIDTINVYTLWRLVTGSTISWMGEESQFIFEVWVDILEDKDRLFVDLKPFILTSTEWISWHECTHDEDNGQPCVVPASQVYRGG